MNNDVLTQGFEPGFSFHGTTTPQKQTTAPKQFGGLKGFLVRNAPAIGGIVGGIGGEAVDLFGGGVAGAAGGQALGQKIQNELTGNNASTTGAAISGGLGQIGGKVLGKVIRKTASTLAKPIDKGAANIANRKAAQTAANEVAPFAGVTKGSDVKGSIDLMKNLGMEATPENMHTAAKLTTGAIDTKPGSYDSAFNTTLRGLIGQGGENGSPVKVNVGNYLDTVKNAINSEPLLGQAEAKTGTGQKLMSSITNNKENNLFGGKGSTTQSADGRDVLDAIQYHDKQAARYSKAAPGTEGEAIGNVHKQASAYLSDQLGKDAGANKAVKNFTLHPDDAQAIKDHVQRNGGSPQLGQHIVDTINNANSVQDLRSAQAPFVRADQLATKADNFAQGKGYVQDINNKVAETAPKSGNGFGQLSSVYEAGSALHGNPAATAVLAAKGARLEPVVNTASSVLGRLRGVTNAPTSALKSVGEKLANTGNGVFNTAKSDLSTVASNVAPQATPGQLLARTVGQAVAQNANNTSQPTNTPQTSSTPTDQLSSQTTTPSPSSDTNSQQFNSANIEKAIMADIAANGGKNVSTLVSLYNTFGSPKSQASDLTATQQKDISTGEAAVGVLNNYMNNLQNSAGGNVASGTLARLMGQYVPFSSAADKNAYAQASNQADVASQIAQAISGGSKSITLVKQIEKGLPTINDSPQAARDKYNKLIQNLQTTMQAQATPVSSIVNGLQ